MPPWPPCRKSIPPIRGIAELRKRIDDSKASAKATFSVFRLGEAATLTLDDQPIGTGGEIENRSVAIGRHKISVKNAQGKQSTLNVDFLDGQKIDYVYDAAVPELRPMAGAADRALIEKNRMREETRSFQVEHTHGALRGRCRGTLAVNATNVVYSTSESDHDFTWAFRQLKLAAKDDRTFEITAQDNKKNTFRFAEPAKAKEFKQLWEKLAQSLK